MAKLNGKAVGEVITEFYGPIEGRNYNVRGMASPPAPAIKIRVVNGDGSVQVQQSQTFQYASASDGPNPYTMEKRANPTSWVNLGAAVSQSSGIVSVAPTVDGVFSAIRVIVATAGATPASAGQVIIDTEWV